MAPHRIKSGSRKRQQNQSGQGDSRKHPQGIGETKEQKPLRRSARLKAVAVKETEQTHARVVMKTLCKTKKSTKPRPLGRTRWHEAKNPSAGVTTVPFVKRPRLSADSAIRRPAARETPLGGSGAPINSIGHWVKEKYWPKEYFEPDIMAHLYARRKSTPSLQHKESVSLATSTSVPSNQKTRGGKSTPYQDPRYEILLETKGSFMNQSEMDVTNESKSLCRMLLEEEQSTPDYSLFRDDVFNKACQKLQRKNEARVIQDIARLIVPSAETLTGFGAKALQNLVESVDEGWNNPVPLTSIRPHPDYSVGFQREAFSEGQRKRLAPFIGNFISGDKSYFMATFYMYFPFLTCESKCSTVTLDTADRQNAHSMTLAVRAVVELFRLAKREQEIHREILAFSVSHDHKEVRIYGHYAVIEGPKTTFFRHPIRNFVFTDLDGKEKWTSYKFTKNVYSTWAPTQLQKALFSHRRFAPGGKLSGPIHLLNKVPGFRQL